MHTVQGRGDGASRDAAASENSVAREERTRESETRANERSRTFPFPVREREREDLFTMEDINNYKRKRIICTQLRVNVRKNQSHKEGVRNRVCRFGSKIRKL